MARILFIGEAVALAHVSRPLVLAAAARAAGHEVVVATDPGSHWLLRDSGVRAEPLPSIGARRFLRNIARGAPLFDRATLARYVHDDLALIRRVGPDAIVGDLRLSLSASARIARVPYVAVCNAYWSPYAASPEYPVPPLDGLRFVPLGVAQPVFDAVRRIAFAWHARPLNRVRRDNALPPLPYDVRHVYTDADWVAYADVPELYPLRDAPPRHRFIGPIVWSPPVALPAWWSSIASQARVVYVTLGSSGDATRLPTIIDALASMGATLLVSTAGAPLPARLPDGVLTADYLPGEAVARRAALVVCNGGAPTTQQALVAGVPVLGVAGHMDQLLNMQAIERAGAGLCLRGDRVDARAIRGAAQRLLSEPAYAAAARRIAQHATGTRAPERFTALLNEALR